MAVKDEDLIVVSNVSRRFATDEGTITALSDVSFTVRRGETVCIVGASGCGKSTLLRAIAGLDPDHDGTIAVGGRVVTQPSRSIGIVFQEPRLFPWLTVRRNIRFPLSGIPKKVKIETANKYIRLVGLEGFERVFPSHLSGGMAQRAGLARALVNDPPVLLLDEPFGALDAFTKITMQNELKRIQREEHTTMIMVTHDIDEAVYLADRVIVLSSRPGRIREIVPVELPEPRDRNSYAFLEVRRAVYSQFFCPEETGQTGS